MKYLYILAIVVLVVVLGIFFFSRGDSDEVVHEEAKVASISLFEQLFIGEFSSLGESEKENLCKGASQLAFHSVSKEDHGDVSLYVCRYEDNRACSLLSARNGICNPVKTIGYETNDDTDRGRLVCVVNGYIVSADKCVIVPGQSCRAGSIAKGRCL